MPHATAELENLEPRRLLAFASVTDGVLVVHGTAKIDRFVISSAGKDGGTTIVTRNRVSESYAWPRLGRVRVNCGPGDDFVQILTDQQVTIFGGLGNDIFYGGGNSITELGEGGNDTLYGSGKSRDYLIGGQDSDYIDGGKGSDGVYGDNFAPVTGVSDVQFIAAGNDTLGGGRGFDAIDGGGGNDLIYGGRDDDRIEGGPGNDTMYGGDGRDQFIDSGHDFVEDVNVNGADVIDGQGGRDEWHRENDTVGTRLSLDDVANDGNPAHDGDPAEDDNVVSVEVVYTGSGNDLVDYSAVVSDGSFGDVLVPVFADTGTGTDTVIGSKYADLIRDAESVLGNDGDDDITGSSSNCTLIGGTGNDTIASSIGNDSLEGNAGNDSIIAGGGNDTILGNRGHDTILAQDGDDRIFGGPETSDTIVGGPGNDAAADDPKDTYDSVETLLS